MGPSEISGPHTNMSFVFVVCLSIHTMDSAHTEWTAKDNDVVMDKNILSAFYQKSLIKEYCVIPSSW